MKASELVKQLQAAIEQEGDAEVRMEVCREGQRFTQGADYVLGRPAGFLVLSQEAWDADPINALPIHEKRPEDVRH